jgi:hypothetical protein
MEKVIKQKPCFTQNQFWILDRMKKTKAHEYSSLFVIPTATRGDRWRFINDVNKNGAYCKSSSYETDTEGAVSELETKPPHSSEPVAIPSSTCSVGIRSTFLPRCSSRGYCLGNNIRSDIFSAEPINVHCLRSETILFQFKVVCRPGERSFVWNCFDTKLINQLKNSGYIMYCLFSYRAM